MNELSYASGVQRRAILNILTPIGMGVNVDTPKKYTRVCISDSFVITRCARTNRASRGLAGDGTLRPSAPQLVHAVPRAARAKPQARTARCRAREHEMPTANGRRAEQNCPLLIQRPYRGDCHRLYHWAGGLRPECAGSATRLQDCLKPMWRIRTPRNLSLRAGDFSVEDDEATRCGGTFDPELSLRHGIAAADGLAVSKLCKVTTHRALPRRPHSRRV